MGVTDLWVIAGLHNKQPDSSRQLMVLKTLK